jgi:hypothetical protein
MSNDDLFAPPSQEEIDDAMFAAPTEDELKSISPTPSETPPEKRNYDMGESFTKGAVQGATMGFGDELSGALNSGMDKTQALLNKLGLASPSPSQVDEQLRQKGFSGDLLDKNKTMYTEGRDVARAENKEAESQNPGSYIGGNVAGGLATALIPGAVGSKLLTPVGNVLKGSGTAAKIGNSAINALPIGALVGAGMSESNDVSGLAQDVATGALTSGVASGALTGVGQGVGKIANKTAQVVEDKFPSVYRAFKKGEEGITTYGKEFADETNTKLQDITGKVRDFVLGKRNEVSQKTAKTIDTLGKQINDVESDIVNYHKNLMEKSGERFEKSKLGSAKQIELKLLQQKQNIGKTFDTIDQQLDDSGILFNNNDKISKLGETLQDNGLMPDQAQYFQSKFEPFLKKGDLNIQELRNLKNMARDLSSSDNIPVAKAFQKFYREVTDNQINILEQSGIPDIANNLKSANQKYINLLDLNDEFIGGLNRDRTLGKALTDDKTINTLSSMIKSDAKNLNKSNILQEKVEKLSPELGNLVGNVKKDLGNKANFLEQIPSIPELKQNSGQLQKLQELLQQAKTKPEIRTQMDELMNSSEKKINDYVLGNLGAVEDAVVSPKKINIENVLDAYKSATGDKNVSKNVSELIKDTELVKNATEGFHGTPSLRSLGLLESAAQYPSNIAGRAKTGVNNIFKGDIKDIVSNLKNFNTKEAGIYAKQLEVAAKNGSQESKNATIFSLMQQPTFRKMMNVNKDDENK